MKIFGLEIENRTDVLAFAAFLLSIATILNQLSSFIEGPEIKLHNSDRVLFKSEAFEENGTNYLRLGAALAYTNSGASGYNAALIGETVNYSIGKKTYSQKWQRFITFDVDRKKLVAINSKPAVAATISAGDAIAHDTYFAPFRKQCEASQSQCLSKQWDNYLPFKMFLNQIQNDKKIKLEFIGHIHGHSDEKTTCAVIVDNNMIEKLTKNGWYSASCWS